MPKIVNKSIIDECMRMCALKFLESISFNEVYIREVNKYQENKEQIDFFNILKTIRNSNKIKLKKKVIKD